MNELHSITPTRVPVYLHPSIDDTKELVAGDSKTQEAKFEVVVRHAPSSVRHIHSLRGIAQIEQQKLLYTRQRLVEEQNRIIQELTICDTELFAVNDIIARINRVCTEA